VSEDLTTWADALEAVIRQSSEPRAIDRVAVIADTASTQDVARSMSAGTPGLLVIAGRQTGGRGRLGRPWHDTPAKSLAMSVALDAHRFSQALVSLGVGVAIARASERACALRRLGLRWPNDVVDPETGRKLAGVLIERSGAQLIVGMGVNVSQSPADWPEALRDDAASLAQLGSPMSRLEFARLLLAELEAALATPEEPLSEAWGARDILVGTRRTFVSGNERRTGLVRSIAPTSEIVIEDDTGARRTLSAPTTSLMPETDADPGEQARGRCG